MSAYLIHDQQDGLIIATYVLEGAIVVEVGELSRLSCVMVGKEVRRRESCVRRGGFCNLNQC